MIFEWSVLQNLYYFEVLELAAMSYQLEKLKDTEPTKSQPAD
ncbi:hypothetical protein GLIP_3731 [Aliiglaciecola lipolytica E3]|uniref:Uncharacterized protein n=1 Tax=Aliiglaciecola lipolytica E3 TaxID=1127673 RepID=K6YDW2_9ALTE|nr:hypothetical protein GLIP_3731 [Aliiglaciecola lipolytica E3]